MFEKVLAQHHRRGRQRTRAALTASIGAHALLALGAAHIPLGRAGTAPATEELVTFVDIPVPTAPVAPAPPAPPPTASRRRPITTARSAGSPRTSTTPPAVRPG